MRDRLRALLARTPAPALLLPVLALLAVVLLGIGGASALARRSPGEQADVTVSAAVEAPTAASASPRPPEAASVPSATADAPSASASLSQDQRARATSTTAPSTSSPAGTASGAPSPPAASPTIVPAPSTAAAATTAAAAVATPAQPIIQAPSSTGVGEAFALHVLAPGAASVSIELDGATYRAAPGGDRFWLVLGVPVAASTGPRTIRATARNSAGAVLGTSFAGVQFTPVQRPVDYLELTEEQGSVLTEEAGRLELALRAAQFAQFDSQKRWSGFFQRPLFGAQTTAFGEGRSINGGPIGGFHSGMDIAADVGEPVRASAAGRVAWVGEMPIRGRSVIIDHGAGVKSGYHHLDATLVAEGSLVGAGHVLGAAGSTGLSTGPHLHWEVTVWGVNVDPLQWTTQSFEP